MAAWRWGKRNCNLRIKTRGREKQTSAVLLEKRLPSKILTFVVLLCKECQSQSIVNQPQERYTSKEPKRSFNYSSFLNAIHCHLSHLKSYSPTSIKGPLLLELPPLHNGLDVSSLAYTTLKRPIWWLFYKGLKLYTHFSCFSSFAQ